MIDVLDKRFLDELLLMDRDNHEKFVKKVDKLQCPICYDLSTTEIHKDDSEFCQGKGNDCVTCWHNALEEYSYRVYRKPWRDKNC